MKGGRNTVTNDSMEDRPRKVYPGATTAELADSRLWGTPGHGPKVYRQ